MQQDQGIKGFTLLELIVVIVIIGIISAVGYPNFTSWKDEREARYSAEKVASMISNLGTQVNRGSLSYSQLWIKWKKVGNENFPVLFSKGMRSSTYSNILNQGKTPDCKMTAQGTWDDIKGLSTTIDKTLYSNYLEYYDPESGIDKTKIALQFGNDSAVCFGKSGNYYKAKGDLPLKAGNANIKIEDINTPNYIIVCLKKTLDKYGLGTTCPRGTTLKEPAYLIKWSRFANISKYKWNENNKTWNRQ